MLFLLIYVDDVLVLGNNNQFNIASRLEQLSYGFAIKYHNPLHYFLGVDIKYFDREAFLSQHKYIHDLILRTKMLDSNPVVTSQFLADKPSPLNNILTDANAFCSIF